MIAGVAGLPFFQTWVQKGKKVSFAEEHRKSRYIGWIDSLHPFILAKWSKVGNIFLCRGDKTPWGDEILAGWRKKGFPQKFIGDWNNRLRRDPRKSDISLITNKWDPNNPLKKSPVLSGWFPNNQDPYPPPSILHANGVARHPDESAILVVHQLQGHL